MRALPETENVDPKEVEKWRVLLDESKIDDEAFLSNFTIRSQENDEFGRPKDVPFTLRYVQKKLHDLEDYVETKLAEYMELHIPKARKEGVSSHSLARFGFCRVLRRPGYKTIMTAHTAEATNVHRELLEQLSKQVNWGALANLGYAITKNTGRSFSIEHPGGMVSGITFLTARSKGLGRGETPNCVISTERPHYEKNANRDFFSILSSMAKARGNCWIDESTANGEGDEFHSDCMRAEEGVGIGRLLFLASYEHTLNYRPFRSDQERSDLLAALGDPRYGEPGEEVEAGKECLRYQSEEMGLDDDEAIAKSEEFLNWRRMELDAGCRGSLDHLHQEQPLTLAQAFLGSGRPVFDYRLLKSWMEPTSERMTRRERGQLDATLGPIKFIGHPIGALSVYERPTKGNVYCWGMDVARGEEIISGTGKSADWTVVNVKDARTGRTVAKFRAHVTTPEAARTLLLIARWYESDGVLARGYVERGGGYGDSVIQSFLEIDDGKWAEALLASPPSESAKLRGQVDDIVGFNATRPGKATMKLRGEEFLQEIGHHDPRSPRESPYDSETLNELKIFSYTDHGGMEAPSGQHDDCVIAELLALQARWKLLGAGEVPLSSKAPKKLDPWEEADMLMAIPDSGMNTETCDPQLGPLYGGKRPLKVSRTVGRVGT